MLRYPDKKFGYRSKKSRYRSNALKSGNRSRKIRIIIYIGNPDIVEIFITSKSGYQVTGVLLDV